MRWSVLVVLIALFGCSVSDSKRPSIIDNGAILIKQSIIHGIYIQCYKCETGEWPSTFDKVSKFSPKLDKCIEVHNEINSLGNENLFKVYPTAMIEVVDDENIRIWIKEKNINGKITPLQRKINVNFRIENNDKICT